MTRCLRLTFKGRVADEIREVARFGCRWLRRHAVVTSPLDVWVVDAPAVYVGTDVDGGYGFGVFLVGPRPRPTILIAGRPPRRELRTRGERREFVLSTLSHEIQHYLQHRDGRPVNHRGVERATRQMAAEMLKAWEGR